jgi:conjugative relaxase-like TrwC/TraI family protein
VTVRVTTLKGTEAGCYYAERLPSYYLDGGEPPGRWWGAAGGDLGLAGDVGPEAFLALMAGKDPATGLDLGRRYGEASVRGYDATFSAPKSVSLLWALGDKRLQTEVLEAHDGAVDATLSWIESHAHTRLRRNGHVVCVDAEGLVVGVFRQHTSRRLDPQLHTHAVIANRVKAPDGRWLALDARTIKIDQRTVSAVYHANLRSELAGRLGVEWRQPENGIAEIEGISCEVLAEFSQRTSDVDRRAAGKLERFRRKMGREPTVKERWRLEREAVLDSRPAKPHGVDLSDLRDDWRERTIDLGYDPELLVRRALARRVEVSGLDEKVAGRMVEAALESLNERQSSWRPAELVREVAAAVPTTTAVASADLTETLDRLAVELADGRCVDISRPIPTGLELRRDGRPVTEAAVDRTLTTRSILDEEEDLTARAQHRRGQARTSRRPRMIRVTVDLSPGQEEAVAAVAGDGGLELIVGPAGAGKTTMLAKAKLNLALQGRQVFGVAPTAAAAEVIGNETRMRADTLDKLLSEHSHPTRPPDPEFDLPRGTTVIVDEAATASTPKLAALFRLADQHDWRLVLVGDPRQFSAVGRGGMFSHLVDIHGAVELDQVHRFDHPWERRASLVLRTGDPGALVEYDRRGRLHGGTLEQVETGIITAWRDARSRGDTVALMANNTDTVARLNHLAQQTRIRDKELDPAGPSLRIGDTNMQLGDEVVTRRNDRTLRTDQHLMVKNRDHWTITNIHRDRSATITGRTGTIRLPADYVTEHVELGYAQTSHATQGRTVDVALLLVNSPTDSHGVYTAMTRGREANHAYVVTDDNQTSLDVLTQALARDWIDQPAVARRLDLNHDPQEQIEPPLPGEAHKIDELMRRARRHIAERQERERRVERSLGLGR